MQPNAIRFYNVSSVTIDGFQVTRSVTINEDLTFKCQVGNIETNLQALGWKLPPYLTDVASLICIFNIVSSSKMCLGCCSEKFESLNLENKGHWTVRRVINQLQSSAQKTYIVSVTCLGFIELDAKRTICGQCKILENSLRMRMSRFQQSRMSANEQLTSSSKNLRYMVEDEVRERLKTEQRKRVNVEKKEKYLRRKLKEEKRTRQLTTKDHNDMCQILQDIENEQIAQGKRDSEVFKDNPEMQFFWELQKDILQQGTNNSNNSYNFLYY